MVGTSPTSQRAPLQRRPYSTEISIEDIETKVRRLRRGWPPGSSLQVVSALFAMLRVGTNLPKLTSFTKYSTDLLLKLTDDLRAHGQLLAGVPSAQFVLKQCPGSEELIESLTGSRPIGDDSVHQAVFAPPGTTTSSNIRKVASVSDSSSPAIKSVESSPDPAREVCGKDGCGKIPQHTGRCKIQGILKERRISPAVQQASSVFHEVMASGNGAATSPGLVHEVPDDPEPVHQASGSVGETPEGFRFSVSLKSPDGYYTAQGTTRAEFVRAQKVLDVMLAP